MATLLQLRESARDDRRQQLAEVQRADAELEKQLATLDAEQNQLQEEHRAAVGSGQLNLARLVNAQHYASVLRAQAAELQCRRQSLAIEIDRRRQTLVAADRDVRALEKLRQREAQAHRQNEDRQSNKQLDEAGQRIAGK